MFTTATHVLKDLRNTKLETKVMKKQIKKYIQRLQLSKEK